MSLDRKDYIEKTEHQEGSEQDILKVCRTFLFVSENLKVVEMSHSSVSDYLALKFSGKLEDLLKDTKGQIDPDKLLQDSHDLSKVLVNATVAQESISYLLSTKDLKLGQDHTINPESLLSYTAEFWFQHVKVAIRLANKVTNDDQQNTLENVLKTLRDSIRALLDPQNQGAFENWLAIHDPDEVERIKGKDHTSGDPRGQQLYYAMFLGLWVVARDMIDDGWDVNIIGGYFGTCLQLASYRGNEPTVSKLLEKHASMNVEAGIFGSALQAAAAQGHTSICSLLLNNGADVNISCGLLCNPLQAALTRRSKATIELLTDRIVQVDANSGKVAKALMISRELQESSAKSQPTWISNPHCHDIVTKVSDSDKNDEWYLYNQLPLVGLCSMMKLFTNQRSVKNVDSQALEIMARIISEHGDFLARQIMLQTDFKASPLAEILTRIYEDIFKIQFHTLRRSHMVSSKRIVNIFRSLYLPRKDGASLETIMAMDERAKQIEQLVEVAELNSLMRHPLSDQLREFIEKQAEQAEQAANIANVQRSADPGTSEQFKTSSQTAQCITGNPLQTNQLTIEACELSQDESQKISEQLWAGTETGVILASKPEGQAALENVKRNVFRRMPGVLQIEPQASKAGDNTTSAQEKVDEEDDTSADNTPYKEEEVQETKSLTREDTRAPPGNADEEDDASVVKAPPREEEVQETKPLIREDAVTTQEEVDKEDDPKSEDEPKDVEVREMKSLAREDTVAAEKKVDEEDDTSAEKNPPKEAEVQEKPLTREQELSAGLAYVKEEMSQLRKEVKELRGLVQKMTKVLEHKDLLKASESDKFSDE